MLFGYYHSAGTMTREETGPPVPELDPVRALAAVLTRMPAAGIGPGDVLAGSGYAHRDPAAWAIPLRRAGAQLVQDLMGTWQATAKRALGVKLSVQSAGPVCQIDACPGLSTWMPWCREAGSARRGWCRVTRTVDQGTRSLCGDPGPGISPPPPPARQRHAGPHPRKALFVTVWVIVA